MIILPGFHMEKYRDQDHREDTPNFTDRKSEGVSGILYYYLTKYEFSKTVK